MITGYKPKTHLLIKNNSFYHCPPFTLSSLSCRILLVNSLWFIFLSFTPLYPAPRLPPPAGTRVGSVRCRSAGRQSWDEPRLPQTGLGGASWNPAALWSCTWCTSRGASLGCLSPQSECYGPCGLLAKNGCSQ